MDIRDRLTGARDEFAKASKEYESLKAKVVKAVQGKSAFPMDILSELVESAKVKMLEASDRLSSITAEMESDKKRVKKILSDYRNLIRWSEIFDKSDTAAKKMIMGYTSIGYMCTATISCISFAESYIARAGGLP